MRRPLGADRCGGHTLKFGFQLYLEEEVQIRCLKFVTFSAKMLKVMVQPFAFRLAFPFKQRPSVKKKKKKINSMREQSPEEQNNERKHKTKALIWLSVPHSFHCLCSGRTPLIFGLSVALQVKSLATAIATYSVLDVECMASPLLPLAGEKVNITDVDANMTKT